MTLAWTEIPGDVTELGGGVCVWGGGGCGGGRGGGLGRGERYAITTRMISVLINNAAMRATLMFQ